MTDRRHQNYSMPTLIAALAIVSMLSLQVTTASSAAALSQTGNATANASNNATAASRNATSASHNATNAAGNATVAAGNAIANALAAAGSAIKNATSAAGSAIHNATSAGGKTLQNATTAAGKALQNATSSISKIHPSITVTPNSVNPGDIVIIKGSGFGSNDTITLTLDNSSSAITAKSDSTGAFNATMTTPKDATAAGTHNITATDRQGFSGEASFTIVAIPSNSTSSPSPTTAKS
jgi:IPT/TIG domain-containing protein